MQQYIPRDHMLMLACDLSPELRKRLSTERTAVLLAEIKTEYDRLHAMALLVRPKQKCPPLGTTWAEFEVQRALDPEVQQWRSHPLNQRLMVAQRDLVVLHWIDKYERCPRRPEHVRVAG